MGLPLETLVMHGIALGIDGPDRYEVDKAAQWEFEDPFSAWGCCILWLKLWVFLLLEFRIHEDVHAGAWGGSNKSWGLSTGGHLFSYLRISWGYQGGLLDLEGPLIYLMSNSPYPYWYGSMFEGRGTSFPLKSQVAVRTREIKFVLVAE